MCRSDFLVLLAGLLVIAANASTYPPPGGYAPPPPPYDPYQQQAQAQQMAQAQQGPPGQPLGQPLHYPPPSAYPYRQEDLVGRLKQGINAVRNVLVPKIEARSEPQSKGPEHPQGQLMPQSQPEEQSWNAQTPLHPPFSPISDWDPHDPPPPDKQTGIVPPDARPAYFEFPTITAVEDNVVFILHPLEVAHKMALFSGSGKDKLQIFSDFERVFTQFVVDGHISVNTVDMLESSGILTTLMVDEMNAAIRAVPDQDDLQAIMQSIQAVFVRANISMASISSVIQRDQHFLGLRRDAQEIVAVLGQLGVPGYIFSDGYGDVVKQVLCPEQSVPANLHIISNFFHAGPDGMIRACSTPCVHAENMNATTAAAVVGMPLPPRPYAIVIGSQESNLHMTDGLPIQEQLTIAFMDVTDDLQFRLPVFLEKFDIVIVGETMAYVKSLLEDILGKPQRFTALPKGLGMVLNNPPPVPPSFLLPPMYTRPYGQLRGESAERPLG